MENLIMWNFLSAKISASSARLDQYVAEIPVS